MPFDPRSRHLRPERVYVCGHQNPDTDSISSALAYAELKGALDHTREYVPVRLGELNAQTSWALERAGAEAPQLLPHISLRAGDVMREEFPVAEIGTPLRRAGQMMVSTGLDLLPVVDGDGHLAGVLTERAFARRYVRDSNEVPRLLDSTSVEAMVEVLEGELITGEGGLCVDGRVWVLARELGGMLSDLGTGDVAVVGDRHDAQLEALELGIAVLVVSNATPVPESTLARAREKGTPVIATPLDSYVAGRMITLSSPCLALAENDPLTVQARELVEDISEDVKDVSYRAAVVLDRDSRPIGLVTRADLVDPSPRKVILVDHAESAQSVPGLEEAEIVEILDHHHIGSIETTQPIRATFDPVGCTCTLIAERFGKSGVIPTSATATMMLAAILSDTVIMSSPTTTDRDVAAARALAESLGVVAEEFGREMFEASSDVSDLDADQLLGRDLKGYDLGSGQTICIGQVETVGDALLERAGELHEAAESLREQSGHRLVALMITDVSVGGTQLLIAGDLAMAERAFGTSAVDALIPLPGVMSRKKQVAPPLLKAA
ncbi:MAG: putative manganese-dependent inorganic diphosphatase [Solirubrobacterales bacterium]|nr:putative manganese-dependent inorganic diphosphatase [Solirubrobacterales bacterium]